MNGKLKWLLLMSGFVVALALLFAVFGEPGEVHEPILDLRETTPE